MSDAAAWERALESIGRTHEKLDALVGDQRHLAAAVIQIGRKLDQHVADDERRFGRIRRDAAQAPIPPPPPVQRAQLSSFNGDEAEITGQHLAIVEQEKTKRWQLVAAAFTTIALAVAGGMLAGRATAPTQLSVPYAVPTGGAK